MRLPYGYQKSLIGSSPWARRWSQVRRLAWSQSSNGNGVVNDPARSRTDGNVTRAETTGTTAIANARDRATRRTCRASRLAPVSGGAAPASAGSVVDGRVQSPEPGEYGGRLDDGCRSRDTSAMDEPRAEHGGADDDEDEQ